MAWCKRDVGGEYELTLYKPPKGFTIRTWIEHLRAEATEDYRKQVAQIDAEAV